MSQLLAFSNTIGNVEFVVQLQSSRRSYLKSCRDVEVGRVDVTVLVDALMMGHLCFALVVQIFELKSCASRKRMVDDYELVSECAVARKFVGGGGGGGHRRRRRPGGDARYGVMIEDDASWNRMSWSLSLP